MKIKIVKGIFFILFISILSGCSLMKTDVVDLDGLKVAYIVRKGSLEDKSVGELGYLGIKKAIDQLGIKEEVLEVDLENPSQIEKKIKKVADRNDLIIMNGRELSQLSQEMSAMYRDKSIIIIGVKENETNIEDVNFAEEEAGFLMGIIAGRTTKTNKVGFITYEKFDDTDRLLSGFMAGIKTVNEEVAKNLLKGDNITYVTLDTSIDKVNEEAVSLIKNGVDIIFEKLAQEEIGVFKAAKENNIKVIGVGTDKYEVYPEYSDIILSSQIKKVDQIVFEAIEQKKNGKLITGETKSNLIDLASGKLDYAESTEKTVTSDIFTEVKKYKDLIIKKKLWVPINRSQVIEFKPS